MLTYAVIGIGGAIGSVLRAWIGILMVALTGPAFPWGTILINVVGSFVIGFFGTLTALEGRFAVPPELRAFVMVGVCGGFTTFSSFSLQTLDLLRDERPGQALGNIALSVLLCLGSVSLGYTAARLLRASPIAALAPPGPDSLGDQVLVALHGPDDVQPMLEMAARLMAREGGGGTTALAITGPAQADLLPTEELMTGERAEDLANRRRAWIGDSRQTLDAWVAAQRRSGRKARWVEVKGDAEAAILEHGRSAHLLLLEHRPEDRVGLRRIRTALLHALRPVLLVPPGGAGAVGRVVAVAWHDDGQAREAVRRAMPILSKAERVVVLQVGAPADELPEEVFGTLPVGRVTREQEGDDVGAQLVGMAREAGADMLVMGSYDHNPIGERLFDGVTESVLRLADLPVFMQPREA